MKKMNQLKVNILFCVITTMVISIATAQNPLLNVLSEPSATLPDIGGAPGQAVIVPLSVFNFNQLEGLDVIITFDPDIAEITGATLSNGVLADEDYELITNFNQQNQVAITIYATGNLFSGSGDAVFLSFTCLAVGNSELNFSKFEVNEENYLFNCSNGSISVYQGQLHQILLQPGWSGISSYLSPAESDIQNLLSAIEQNLVVIQNFEGVYFPTGNINTLVDWDYTQGYQIKVDAPLTLEISGSDPIEKTISLSQGWNLLPVLSENDVMVNDLFVGQIEKIDIIKEAVGLKVFWPEKQISTLEILVPGKSYLVKMNQNAVIEF